MSGSLNPIRKDLAPPIRFGLCTQTCQVLQNSLGENCIGSAGWRLGPAAFSLEQTGGRIPVSRKGPQTLNGGSALHLKVGATLEIRTLPRSQPLALAGKVAYALGSGQG
jgi:hypothetical protein